MRILVVGGTSGIGLEIAKSLKKGGDEVTLLGRRKAVSGFEVISADVANEAELAAALAGYAKTPVDALIYSAAMFEKRKPLAEYSYKECAAVYGVNVFGFIGCLKALQTALSKNGGRVIVINSIAGRRFSQSAGILYSSSKAALSGLVRQLSQSLAADRILINSLFLGPVDAGMTPGNLSAGEIAALGAGLPLKRLARVEDVIPAISFLLDPANEYVTGAGIDVNGGGFVTG